MPKRIEQGGWPETKRRLVDAGVNLMRSRGFNATTLDDICHEAGVTKGGLFHYFKNKDDLAKAALAEFAEGKAADFQSAPFRKLADPMARVFGRLDFVLESVKTTRLTKGCLIGMLAQELSFTNPELRRNCQEKFGWIADDFEADLAKAKEACAPQASFHPKSLAMLYVSIVQGSLMLAKTSESNRVLVENIRQFRDYVETLFGQVCVSTGKQQAKVSAESRH
jgi:TetR/AcrR family transcriptional repressor of nem operon